MKIISGLYKGRIIQGFDIDGTRPTMERVKESLFAMLQDSMKDSVVLDLFSGSGNLGIEALSQGAKEIYLVDKNRQATKTIAENIKKMNISKAHILNQDYQNALAIFSKEKIQFDLIFLDPPYQTDYIENSITLIEKYQLLKENGLIVCENSDRNRIIYPVNYQIVKEKKYGDKWVVILQNL